MAHLHGYIPYFYATLPSENFTAADCERFKVTRIRLTKTFLLDDRILLAKFSRRSSKRIARKRRHRGRSRPFGGIGTQDQRLRFSARGEKNPNVEDQRSVAAIHRHIATNSRKRILLDGKQNASGRIQNFRDEHRFWNSVRKMFLDRTRWTRRSWLKIDGWFEHCRMQLDRNSSWKIFYSLQCDAWHHATVKNTITVIDRISPSFFLLFSLCSCQIELDVWAHHIISHPADGDWQRIAPLRIMSYDIECAGRKGLSSIEDLMKRSRSFSREGIFPEPEHDPVIQIASMVIRQGEKAEFIKTVFTLGTCANIAGVGVIECHTEQELLEVRHKARWDPSQRWFSVS